MKYRSLKWFIPILFLVCMIFTPFNTINAKKTEKELYPSIDKSDESDNVKPGSGKSGDSAEFERPDYGEGLDDILDSQDSEKERDNHEREKTSDVESDIPTDEIDGESEKNEGESTKSGENNEKDEVDEGAR